VTSAEADEDESENREYVEAGGGSSIAMNPVRVSYLRDDPLFRFRPSYNCVTVMHSLAVPGGVQ
jgi:hypothetical protein